MSGGDDGAVRTWVLRGAAEEWRCEGSLTGHRGGVRCLAAWGGRPVSGGADGTVRVVFEKLPRNILNFHSI